MKNEIRALQGLNHPNIIRILDANLDRRWFVTEYFPERSLAEPKHRNKYKGRLIDALVAFRPLVAGVAALHARKLVHRDIKPQNIFVSPGRGLVLGDFGLVFFADEERTRVSDTLENVGSRDWMPAWAMGMRVEDLNRHSTFFARESPVVHGIGQGNAPPLVYSRAAVRTRETVPRRRPTCSGQNRTGQMRRREGERLPARRWRAA